MARLFGHTVRFMLNTCLPSGSLEFGYVLGRGCLFDQPSIKNLGHQITNELSQQTTLCMCCHNLLLKELSHSTVRGLSEAVPWFPPTFTPWPSPFSHFALYLFMVINLSQKNKQMLSSETFYQITGPGWGKGVILGTPNTQHLKNCERCIGELFNVLFITFSYQFSVLPSSQDNAY